jgi:hypothetical protein
MTTRGALVGGNDNAATNSVFISQGYAGTDTFSAKGTTGAAPASGTAIATISAPGAGTYEILAVVFLTGAAGASEINNAQVNHGAVKSADIPVVPVINVIQLPVVIERVTVAAGEDIVLKVGGTNGTASSVYSGIVFGTLLAS